jgi:hypothetical protein
LNVELVASILVLLSDSHDVIGVFYA